MLLVPIKHHIPDKIGFFSAGPPQLQVLQDLVFAEMVFAIICEFSLVACAALLMPFTTDPKLAGNPLLVGPALMGAAVVVAWIANCFDKHRRSDFEWPDWE